MEIQSVIHSRNRLIIHKVVAWHNGNVVFGIFEPCHFRHPF